MNKLVSIIIPVYNAQSTLDLCLKSLINQSYENIEYIFVNDCSTDNSLDTIKQFAEKYSSDNRIIKIISHEVNKGVASARNTGLSNATGEYIYFVDSDDTIERDAISLMAKEMDQQKLDIIGIEWFLSFNKSERYMSQNSFSTPDEALINMMYGVIRWNLWLFMVRRSLYINNNICFNAGQDMGEDMMVMFKLFINAKRVFLLKKPLYHYNQTNSMSLTNQYNESHRVQVTNNVVEIERYMLEQQREDLLKYTSYLKLNIKLPLLISNKRSNYILWRKWFNEANGCIMSNPKLSMRIKILQKAASNGLYIYIHLYYFLINKIFYSIIYR